MSLINSFHKIFPQPTCRMAQREQKKIDRFIGGDDDVTKSLAAKIIQIYSIELKIAIWNENLMKLFMLLHNLSVYLHQKQMKIVSILKIFPPMKIASLFSRGKLSFSPIFLVIILEICCLISIHAIEIQHVKGIFTSPPSILEMEISHRNFKDSKLPTYTFSHFFDKEKIFFTVFPRWLIHKTSQRKFLLPSFANIFTV